ncbi:MAG: N-acetylmuramoyl-L-alanine amidase [Bacillota bacterium]
MFKVGIDPGHGGSDPGAIGPTGLQEKDINMSVGLLVARLLQEQGLAIVLTRDKDEQVTLADRSSRLNLARVDLVISIHVNSSLNHQANYVANFILASGGDAERAARLLQEELMTVTGWPKPAAPHGVIEKNLHMLRETKAPAVLLEMGFISNPLQEAQLKEPDFQILLATAIVRGISQYFDFPHRECQGQGIGETINVIIKGRQYQGILIEGKTYVHVRILEELGIGVRWEEGAKTVYVG